MQRFCPYCGKEVTEQAVVCVHCGASLKNQKVSDPNAKSKLVSGLLGIFVGSLGIHNFYLGYTGKAVAQLLMTVLSCGILSPVSAGWGLIEGIMILTGSINCDANGYPLGD